MKKDFDGILAELKRRATIEKFLESTNSPVKLRNYFQANYINILSNSLTYTDDSYYNHTEGKSSDKYTFLAKVIIVERDEEKETVNFKYLQKDRNYLNHMTVKFKDATPYVGSNVLTENDFIEFLNVAII